MFKRIGLTMAIAAGILAFAAPRQASAETHFGVYIGTAPRVYAPAPAYDYDPYATPYVDPYYAPAPVYSYPAPVYVSPYNYGYRDRGWRDRGWGDHDRHEMRERFRHEEHERREHGRW